MYGMQKKKLHNDEEQAYDTGQIGVQEVLPILPETYAAQGNKVTIKSKRFNRKRNELVNEYHAGQ